MDKLTLKAMFKALKVELYKDSIYKILDKVEPDIRVELIKYLMEN